MSPRPILPKSPLDPSTAGAAGGEAPSEPAVGDSQSDSSEPAGDPQSDSNELTPGAPQSDSIEPADGHPQSNTSEPAQSHPLRLRPNGSSQPLQHPDESADSSRRDSSAAPGQSSPLKRKSDDDVDPLRPFGSFALTPIQESAPTNDAPAVPATISESPRPLQIGSSSRQATNISNDAQAAHNRYGDMIYGAWNLKRPRLDGEPEEEEEDLMPSDYLGIKVEEGVQEEQEFGNIPVKYEDAAQEEQKDVSFSIKVEDYLQEDREYFEPPIKAEDEAQEDQKPTEPPFKAEDAVKKEEEDEKDETPVKKEENEEKKDIDSITPASPLIPAAAAATNFNIAAGTLNYNTADARYFIYNAHPSIPDGLKMRFLKSGSPATDNLVYALPRELFENLVAQLNADFEKYQRRFLAGTGRFGTARHWMTWPNWQQVEGDSAGVVHPHPCANCLDLEFVGARLPGRCSWMGAEGARACRGCAEARVFCIVSIGGEPTVLRNPVGRVVGGVNGIGVAQMNGSGDDAVV
jgi:hypothetical protein